MRERERHRLMLIIIPNVSGFEMSVTVGLIVYRTPKRKQVGSRSRSKAKQLRV